MGDITLSAFGLIALASLTLIAVGAFRRSRLLMILGTALLLALAGLWVVGLPGATGGLLPLVFLKRRRPLKDAAW